jgi:heme/copper-type cytochrome/quinol oxidase subunit 2
MRGGAGLLAAAAALALSGCAGTAPATTQAAGGAGTTTTADTATSTGAAPSGAAASGAAAAAAAEAQQITVEYANGRVTGDTGRVVVEAGRPVTLTVTSDVADEAHLHGYDLETELTPGQAAELRFDATIPGVFELELHEAGTVLLTLQVG